MFTQIDLALSVEALLPKPLRHRFTVAKEKIHPNRELTWWEKMEEFIWGSDHFPTGTDIASVLNTTEQVSLFFHGCKKRLCGKALV